ncbi:MAG: UDP-N-acetylmuramate--L-alanine ligase, partial [Acutalibacteraceae bacterium]
DIPVALGHKAEDIEGAELIIYSAAIMKDNPELEAARQKGIPTLERSYALGAITRKFNNVIGVCGTHGKTTVTSMLTQVLVMADRDPSAVIGGYLPLIHGYGRSGNSDTMVCESCEYVDTFLKLSPDTAVILNIDNDHLEYFKTMDNMCCSYRKFADMAHTVIANGDDERVMKTLKGYSGNIITFGFGKNNDYYAENISMQNGVRASFDLMYKGQKKFKIDLSIPGKHNMLNAMACAACAIKEGVDEKDIVSGIDSFKGAGRRFEILGVKRGVTIADDYAHHPAELKATLTAAMNMGYKTVWAVFQPFTFSRTKMLMNDFAEVLKIPDRVVMSEIMGSREINTYGVYTSQLAEKIPGSVWFNTFEEIADYIVKNAGDGDLVITLGCGDIYKAAKLMLQKLDG